MSEKPGPSAPPAPYESDLHPRIVFASMAGIMAAMLMAALDGTIVETAMPRAIAEMNGFEHYTAVITMYLLSATAIVPIVGKLSDMYGRKPFLLAGVVIFVVGSALCGAAQSMLQLVIFRGFQGIGAGFTQAMAFTTIADLYPPARRGRVSGLMGSVFGVATVIGPTIGGFLTDGPGWRWCFYVNLPVGTAAFLVLLFAFPQLTVPKKDRSIDWVGALLLLLGVVPILLGLSWAGRDYAWGSTVIVSLLTGGVAMSLAFLFVETKVKEPILPLTMFRNRVIWTSAVGAMIISVAMYGTILFIPLFLQAVVGRSATQSGAVLTPLMVSIVLSSTASGQILMRIGRYKGIAVFGMVVTGIGLFILAQMDVATSYATVMRNMVMMGVGLGCTLPVFTIAAQNAVGIEQVGVATSSIQFLRSMGGSLGAAVFGAVLTNRFGDTFHRVIVPVFSRQIPAGLLARFENPQALMNPRVAAEMRAGGASLMQQLAPLMTAVKLGLAVALHDVFLTGAALMVVGVVISLLLVDIPLRRTNRPTATSELKDDASAMTMPTFEM